MRRIVLIFGFISCIWGSSVAQAVGELFLPYSWEQASMLAAKEGKLVLVDVYEGKPGVNARLEGIWKKNPVIGRFLKEKIIAIRVNMQSSKGIEFKPRLLLHGYPGIAFFMPYGDLLQMADIEPIVRQPELIREIGEKALQLAEVKRNNSRSVGFESTGLKTALEKAGENRKPVFIYGSKELCKACLLMEKDVFNLDSVADFYNRNFICLHLDAKELTEYLPQGATEFPVFLFLNEKGKVIVQEFGDMDSDSFIRMGEKALERAQGVTFVRELSPEIRRKAQEERKFVLTEFFVSSDIAHKEMVKDVFTDPEVAEFLNRHFVNVALEVQRQDTSWQQYKLTDIPVFVFENTEGKEIHRVVGKLSGTELIKEANKALEGKGVEGMRSAYEAGNRENDFVELYIETLTRAGKSETAGQIASVYLQGLSQEKLKEEKYWRLYEAYGTDVNSDMFRYLLEHREDFHILFGAIGVDRKILSVWKKGAESFVKKTGENYNFDETGFKEYVKRLKKNKVRNWREIVRDVRMLSAEKTEDWRTYVELAEEKWNEGNIPDAELYSWGLKIKEFCHDEAIRFKAARWFAMAVVEMERKERQAGKINLTSYKGFFEKLIDDLVGKN